MSVGFERQLRRCDKTISAVNMFVTSGYRRLAIFFYVFLAFLLIFFYVQQSGEGSSCELVKSYISLTESEKLPEGRQNIFFIESTQPCNEILNLNVRQMCSIESAARQNPDWNVFLYVVEAKGFPATAENVKRWSILRSFKNIHIKVINIKNFTLNSPVEGLIQRGLNSFSSYLKYHRSDILRYTLLWRYAGTYLDLDVISQKPLASLGYNFAVAQEKNYPILLLGAGAINFDSDSLGREISGMILSDLAENFNGHKWDDSSVRVLTRAVAKICGSDQMFDINPNRCKGFQVHPSDTFYPISFSEKEKLMDPQYGKIAMDMVRNSIGVHAWNKVTAGEKLKKTSNSGLVQIAHKYCPSTFDSIDEYY